MLCGSSANENAYKQAMIKYERERRSGAPHSGVQLTSVMANQTPGASSTTILSFDGGFHGRTFGALATTHSKPIHKLDVATFDWPIAPFPRLRYPRHEHEAANAAEEMRCLGETDEIMLRQRAIGRDVAAVVVEPVQGEGGDNHASAAFFIGLRRLCTKHGASFIVDEVQTGCGATGALWCHELWGLPPGEEPDFVTFAKKFQAAGYFHREDCKPDGGYRIFNTWMGATHRLHALSPVCSRAPRNGQRSIAATCHASWFPRRAAPCARSLHLLDPRRAFLARQVSPSSSCSLR
jgi:4-aminobutyrate aminotransferase/(S)-3-amino-2-methylpropionate transaminase